jgi:hypothetical protein
VSEIKDRKKEAEIFADVIKKRRNETHPTNIKEKKENQ